MAAVEFTRRSLLAAAAVVIVAVGWGHAPARAEEPKGDLKAMQGTWVSKDEQGESTWVFKGDRVSLKTPNRAYELTVKLDADAKPAKSIDFHALDDSPNAKGADGKAVYKFDGEALSICMAIGENGRPTEFKNDFPNCVLFELKRKP
jgi:uncharacterized protein (TIGR03067 family)